LEEGVRDFYDIKIKSMDLMPSLKQTEFSNKSIKLVLDKTRNGELYFREITMGYLKQLDLRLDNFVNSMSQKYAITFNNLKRYVELETDDIITDVEYLVIFNFKSSEELRSELPKKVKELKRILEKDLKQGKQKRGGVEQLQDKIIELKLPIINNLDNILTFEVMETYVEHNPEHNPKHNPKNRNSDILKHYKNIIWNKLQSNTKYIETTIGKKCHSYKNWDITPNELWNCDKKLELADLK